MKCSTINFFFILQLFILTLTVIGSGLTNGSKINGNESISQLEKNEFKGLMPEFREKLLSWVEIKKQQSEIQTSNEIQAEHFECGICKASVDSILMFTKLGSNDLVISLIRNSCILFHIGTADFCKGIVETFKEEFLIITKNVNLSSDQICTISLGSPCNEKIDPRLNWTLPLPPKQKLVKKPTNRLYPLNNEVRKEPEETFKFLQISDLHVDLEYKVNTSAACNEPVCCRTGSNYFYSRSLDIATKQKSKLFGIKLSQDDELTAGKWGSYGTCDIPMDTFIQALKEIAAKHLDEIDYVIWTGDIPPHDIWRQSKAYQIEMIKKSSEQFIKYLNDTPIYPAIGNHEGFPVNSFPPKNILPEYPNINMDWLYNPLNEIWDQWLPKGTISSIKKGAYYSIKAKEDLKIISLNTNYCNNENWWLLINGTDPENELTWLIDQLLQAEKANEKVHIIGHIPPGKTDCLQIWSENYYRIVSRFSETIKGQFYGHTHSDEYEIFFNHDQLDQAKSTKDLTKLDAKNVAYLAPSLTTFIGTNPGFRIYEIDSKTYEVVNFHNYFLDLPEANRRSKKDSSYSPEFEYSYNPIDHYGLKDLSAQSWLDLSERMFKNLSLLNEYLYLSKNKASSSEMIENMCGDQNCQRQKVCETLTAKSHDNEICDQVIRRFKN